MATTPTTITSVLAKQSDLLQKIDSIDNDVVRVQSSLSELQEERQALAIQRMRLMSALRELDNTVINLICGTEEELLRFARAINRRLGPAQSSSEG